MSVVVGPLAGPLLDCSMEWEAAGTSQSSRKYFSTSTVSSFFSPSFVFVSASDSALTSAVSTDSDSDSVSVSSAAVASSAITSSTSDSDSASTASTSFVSSAASDSASCPSKSRVEETISLIFLFPWMAA